LQRPNTSVTVKNGTATDMAKMSRDKGARGEREVLDLYRKHGFDGTRGFQSGGQGGGDLVGNMPDIPEVKFVEALRFWDHVAQAAAAVTDGVGWCLWIRKSRQPWMVTVPSERYMQLIELEREIG